MTSTRQAGEATEASVRWRAVLLAAVAACAACGLVYELALLTLAASLNGGGIVATSLIVAGYIAALGAGALLIKPLLAHAAIAFIAVEAVLGIIGGLSAAALYAAFAFLDELDGSTLVLAVGTALIGGLVVGPHQRRLRGDPQPGLYCRPGHRWLDDRDGWRHHHNVDYRDGIRVVHPRDCRPATRRVPASRTTPRGPKGWYPGSPRGCASSGTCGYCAPSG